jgi:hypothetical protein
MAKTPAPYPDEFRRPLVELVRSGRTPEDLAGEVRADRAVDPELGLRKRIERTACEPTV